MKNMTKKVTMITLIIVGTVMLVLGMFVGAEMFLVQQSLVPAILTVVGGAIGLSLGIIIYKKI
ncbi:MAG: hypothetical protein AABW88_04850 [Nanoarchaeota archaeon]